MLPREAPLTSLAAWERLLAGKDILAHPHGPDVANNLRAVLSLWREEHRPRRKLARPCCTAFRYGFGARRFWKAHPPSST